MNNRKKTIYPGVFYRIAKRIGKTGTEKVYYLVFKKDGKLYEEKAGRQYSDDMTPARAAFLRAERIEGKLMSRKEKRAQEETLRQSEANKWTIDRLWMEYQKNNPSLKGMRSYESAYKLYILPNFGTKEPIDILPLDVKRVENKLLKIRSPQTVRHVLELLRRIINFGVNNKLCKGIDFKIDMPKVDNIKTEDLTPSQIDSLLSAIEKDEHPYAGAMMKMALFTGMRRGELFRLKWSHLNRQHGFIDIVDPKGGQDQKIPLNNAAKGVLDSVQKSNSLYVFPGRSGELRVNIAKQVNRIKKAAGLPKHFRPLHGLRHVFASNLANSGKVDMYTLQKLLTHKDSKMTERYSHLRDETLQNASNIAAQLSRRAV